MVERRHSVIDRRSPVDRRRAYSLDYFLAGGVERRRMKERRSPTERREGWIRAGKWISVHVENLK